MKKCRRLIVDRCALVHVYSVETHEDTCEASCTFCTSWHRATVLHTCSTCGTCVPTVHTGLNQLPVCTHGSTFYKQGGKKIKSTVPPLVQSSFCICLTYGLLYGFFCTRAPSNCFPVSNTDVSNRCILSSIVCKSFYDRRPNPFVGIYCCSKMYTHIDHIW